MPGIILSVQAALLLEEPLRRQHNSSASMSAGVALLQFTFLRNQPGPLHGACLSANRLGTALGN